jgi:AP-1 complex subunit gamma-1
MSIRLRELIRAVRACKTMAEERGVITKECALIRTAFKTEQNNFRHRNVAKLLFIHMLGYPSHFGQMECLKLIASPRFAEKRVGYLGLSLLMTENLEVLTLVTNSVQQDMRSNNQYVVGLALTVLGNMSSPDMCRDLFADLDRALRNSNSYIRKKAAVACIRVLQKVPELVEDCLERITGLLTDRNHAVMLTGCTLMQRAMAIGPEHMDSFRPHVRALVKILKNLVLNNYAPEHDVAGVTDPFLQVKVLQLLRVLAKDDDDAVDEMNDVLAQVATNTESNKNAGNCILYECANTILSIDCESGLRVLAINILGPFLLNKDNNTRYVALTMLAKVVETDLGAVQRHRATIVDCLKDPDVSIRRRALELLYSLVNQQNVRALAREMLNYLVVADPEERKSLCNRTADVIQEHAPTTEWHIEVLVSMLQIAGNYASEEIVASLVSLVGTNATTVLYGTHKLYWACKEDLSQLALNHCTAWCLGEFGQHMQSPCPESVGVHSGEAASELEVYELLSKMMRRHSSTDKTRAYVVNASFKLTKRMSDPIVIEKFTKVLKKFSSNVHLELQARSCEYLNLLRPNFVSAAVRDETLKPMPLPDIETLRKKRSRLKTQGGGDDDDSDDSGDDDSDDSDDESSGNKSGIRMPTGGSGSGSSGGIGGADLLDVFGTGSPIRTDGSANSGGGNNSSSGSDLLDLGDIFGGGGSGNGNNNSGLSSTPAAPASNGGDMDDLLGMFGGGDSSSVSSASSSTPTPDFPAITAYDKNGITITLNCYNTGSKGVTRIVSTTTNNTGGSVKNYAFQAAVLAKMSVELSPPSGTSIAPGNSVTQEMTLTNTLVGQVSLCLCYSIVYVFFN